MIGAGDIFVTQFSPIVTSESPKSQDFCESLPCGHGVPSCSYIQCQDVLAEPSRTEPREPAQRESTGPFALY